MEVWIISAVIVCLQRSTTLSRRAEEAASESNEEDQHLHRHLHALLCSVRDHKASVGVKLGSMRGTRRLPSVQPFGNLSARSHPLTLSHPSSSTSSLLPLHAGQNWKTRLADLVISNTSRLCCHCCISTFLLKFAACIPIVGIHSHKSQLRGRMSKESC